MHRRNVKLLGLYTITRVKYLCRPVSDRTPYPLCVARFKFCRKCGSTVGPYVYWNSYSRRNLRRGIYGGNSVGSRPKPLIHGPPSLVRICTSSTELNPKLKENPLQPKKSSETTELIIGPLYRGISYLRLVRLTLDTGQSTHMQCILVTVRCCRETRSSLRHFSWCRPRVPVVLRIGLPPSTKINQGTLTERGSSLRFPFCSLLQVRLGVVPQVIPTPRSYLFVRTLPPPPFPTLVGDLSRGGCRFDINVAPDTSCATSQSSLAKGRTRLEFGSLEVGPSLVHDTKQQTLPVDTRGTRSVTETVLWFRWVCKSNREADGPHRVSGVQLGTGGPSGVQPHVLP